MGKFYGYWEEKAGISCVLVLKGKARETVLAAVNSDKLKSEAGVKSVIDSLDKLFAKNKAESAFTSFENS